ncbi:MAG: polymer-forming cytoskeletal protein [Nitrospirota bacterium]
MWAFGKSQPGTVTSQEDFTFLGKDVVFKGILTLEGSVRVDGQLEGELHSTGTLTVGEHAVIRGNIKTGVLITSGKIKGNITASEKVMILNPGIVIGDIRTPAISIEAGAHFHGLSDMGADKWVEGHNATNEKIHDLAVHRGRLRAPDY